MFPLKDDNPTTRRPILTVLLIAVNIAVFLAEIGPWQPAVGEIVARFGLVPARLTSGEPGAFLTLFSSQFLHGGFLHLGGNMLYLWIFGNNIEDRLGHAGFFIFYIISGICAALFQLFYDPLSEIPMIGASGAVSGILGAYLVCYPHARIKTLLIIVIFIKIVDVPAILLLTAWFFMQFLYMNVDGIAWYAHVGGFIFGLLFAVIFLAGRRSKRAVGA